MSGIILKKQMLTIEFLEHLLRSPCEFLKLIKNLSPWVVGSKFSGVLELGPSDLIDQSESVFFEFEDGKLYLIDFDRNGLINSDIESFLLRSGWKIQSHQNRVHVIK